MGTIEGTTKPGEVTHREIEQQFDLWLGSVQDTITWSRETGSIGEAPLFTGAGSSAYAAAAIAGCWPNAEFIATTDLLVDATLCRSDRDALVSIARSGDSPESVGVVTLLRERKDLRHFAITCNAQGALAHLQGVTSLLLDPRTNDHALAMTSSFSNMVLVGMALQHPIPLLKTAERLKWQADELRPMLRAAAQAAAKHRVTRSIALGSAALYPLAREAALKITELTCGRVAALSETFLGLRHGPMSYLREDTLVVCYLSSDPHTRRYEMDLLNELRSKRLGNIICIADPQWMPNGEAVIQALAPELPDTLRTPFEIVFAQLLAFYLSEAWGLDPDFPSPDGVIHRIVQGVRVYER